MIAHSHPLIDLSLVIFPDLVEERGWLVCFVYLVLMSVCIYTIFSIFLGASWEGTQRGDVEWLEWLDGDCFGREMRE